MSHRIVFSDIDGTLLNADRELSAFTISEIKRIKDKIPIVLISSRMPSAMIHLQEELGIADTPLICYNGGLILVDNQPIHSTGIPLGILEELYSFNRNNTFHISAYNHDEWFVSQMDFWANREMQNTKVTPVVKSAKDVMSQWKVANKDPHKIMCMGDEKQIDSAFRFLENTFGDTIHLYRSKPTYIEIAHKNISKFTAIQLLLDMHFKISVSDAVAFGDNYNDIAMIKEVGTGVAVANAKPEILKIANVITLSGKDDGVATYIKNNI